MYRKGRNAVRHQPGDRGQHDFGIGVHQCHAGIGTDVAFNGLVTFPDGGDDLAAAECARV
jgi:hypothetical protein